MGYVPQLATAIWVGNDNYSPLGNGAPGGGIVAPIWRDFMQQALEDEPVESFRNPSGICSSLGYTFKAQKAQHHETFLESAIGPHLPTSSKGSWDNCC